MLEDQPYFLQTKACGLGEAEDHEYPAEETKAGIESKCSCSCDTIHEGQVGRTDEEVARPIGCGAQGGADTSDYGEAVRIKPILS